MATQTTERSVKSIMEVPIEKLTANPHRDIEEYELDEELINSLMASMAATDVWLGFEARERGDGMYEIAFGHHRLEAAKRLGIEAVTVAVSDRSELDMLDMMIQENHARRNLPQMVVLEEVAAAAAYWNELIKAHPNYVDAPDEIRLRISDKGNYQHAVDDGIGRGFLSDVLGGNIPARAIQNALEMLEAIEEGAEHQTQPEEELEEVETSTTEEAQEVQKKPKKKAVAKTAISVFASQAHAKAFMDGVNDPDVAPVVTLNEHAQLAKRMVTVLGKELTVKSIKKWLRDMAAGRIAERSKDEAGAEIRLHDYELNKLQRETSGLVLQCKKLTTGLSEYTNKIDELGVTERMNGIEVMELSLALGDVENEIERVAFFVGYTREEE